MCQKIINVNPRPYQKLILDNTYHLNAVGYFLGTGAGKTLISLMRFNELPTSNILVICPSKVVFQWIAVIESHTEILKVCQYKKSSDCGSFVKPYKDFAHWWADAKLYKFLKSKNDNIYEWTFKRLLKNNELGIDILGDLSNMCMFADDIELKKFMDLFTDWYNNSPQYILGGYSPIEFRKTFK